MTVLDARWTEARPPYQWPQRSEVNRERAAALCSFLQGQLGASVSISEWISFDPRQAPHTTTIAVTDGVRSLAMSVGDSISRLEESKVLEEVLAGWGGMRQTPAAGDRSVTAPEDPTQDCPPLRLIVLGGEPVLGARLATVLRAAQLGFSWTHLPLGASRQINSARGEGERLGRSRAIVVEAVDLELARRCSRALRAQADTAVLPLLLSVSADQVDALPHLSEGDEFDDFVLRPYSASELAARIRAAQRRQHGAPPPDLLKVRGLELDPAAREARVGDRLIRLTAREHALLSFLGARKGRVLSRSELLLRVWGQSYRGSPRTVDTHINRLRTKLGAEFPIETVRGNGYCLL